MKGIHSGGFMVVLTQLDTVLVLWRVKTQVPGETRGNALQPVNKHISCNFCSEICSLPALVDEAEC